MARSRRTNKWRGKFVPD